MLGRPAKSMFMATLCTAILAACTTTDPYTGEQQVSKTAAGAAIGAAAGAFLGLASGDDARERRQRALIGAGVGGLSGAAIGQYMDRQEAELRQRLQGSGVSVTRDGQNIVLNMPGNVTFDTDQSSLKPEFFDILGSVALVLEEYDKTVIDVAGHTDSTGAAEYNERLAQERADTVASYLRSQGIAARRMLVQGYGERYPIASNESASGRAQNRRVELVLAPISEG